MSKQKAYLKLKSAHQLLFDASHKPHLYISVSPMMVMDMLHHLEDMMTIWRVECIESGGELSMHQPHFRQLFGHGMKLQEIFDEIKRERLLHDLPIEDAMILYGEFSEIAVEMNRLPPR